MYLSKRISGEGLRRFSGSGVGSFGRLLSFLVVTGLTSMESEKYHTKRRSKDHGQRWRAGKTGALRIF